MNFFNRRGAELAEKLKLCILCASAVKNKKRTHRSASLILVRLIREPQCIPTILQSYYPTILFNDFHLRHLITLTNLVDDIQTFYYAAEAGVVAVEVCGVGARVANEKL